jgi:Fic family protein
LVRAYGRLGRLLVVFFLVVRDRGDFEHWLAFFLEGVRTQAVDAVARAERLTDLRERYRTDVQAATRSAANQLVDLAFEQPVLTARAVERRVGVSRPAALSALRQLADLGVLTEVSSGPRGQLRWRAREILGVLTAEG